MPYSLLVGVDAKSDVRWYAEVGPCATRPAALRYGRRTGRCQVCRSTFAGLPSAYARAPVHVRRHASTVYNDLRLLNGDARIPVPLNAAGRVAAASLAVSLAGCPFDLAVHTSFARTRETLNLLLAFHPGVPVAVEPAFRRHPRRSVRGAGHRGVPRVACSSSSFGAGARRGEPGGGSVAVRLRLCAPAGAFDVSCVLLVVHDVPMRFLRNACGGGSVGRAVRTIANLEVVRVGEDRLGAALAVMRRRVAGLSAV